MNTTKRRKSPKSRKTKKTISVPSNVVDKKIYIAAKKFVKKKAKVWPSAYASGQVVQEYKRRGGRYRQVRKSTTLKKSVRRTRFGLQEGYYLPGSGSSTYYNPSVYECLSAFYNRPLTRFGNIARIYKSSMKSNRR
jgi:Family of unknown function (DUF5872)